MRLWGLTAFLVGSSHPGNHLPSQFRPACQLKMAYEDDQDWEAIARGRLDEKPGQVACIAPEIERLLTKADQRTDWCEADGIISADGDILWPPGMTVSVPTIAAPARVPVADTGQLCWCVHRHMCQ